MGSPNNIELDILKKHAKNSTFIIETGTGKSTTALAEIALENNAKFVSIDPSKKWKRCHSRQKHVEYRKGWSIRGSDLIRVGHPDFIDHPAHPPDRVIAINRIQMEGELDLIRKVVQENSQLKLDFFFCDTGEFFGLSEWRVVRDLIQVGGKFACHDIYHPKSIKCFKVVDEIENKLQGWHVLEKTDTIQGLFIAERTFVCDFKIDKQHRARINKGLEDKTYYEDNGYIVSVEFPKRELGVSSYDKYFDTNVKYGKHEHKYAKPLCRLAKEHARSFKAILEVGAGFGFGIERLVNTFKPEKYVAYEFSKPAAKRIRSVVKRIKCKSEVHEETFKGIDCSSFDCVVACEILEHINWDREFIESLPSGCMLLMSLPLFHAFNHVRGYFLPNSIWYRYHDLLDILEIQTVLGKNGKPKWWIVCAKRK